MTTAVLTGDCVETMRRLPDASISAIVTDPPYGMSEHSAKDVRACLAAWLAGEEYRPKGKKGFMGRSWDAWVPGPEVWAEALRVAKPGAYLVAFAAPRTVALMEMAIRLGGWEIRDQLAWIYGSGFPKSHDVSKAIDKAAETRSIIGSRTVAIDRWTAEGRRRLAAGETGSYEIPITIPATESAARWSGWGTALKPAQEPIILARKPLAGTVAANVLEHGTGALNIDGCRIDGGERAKIDATARTTPSQFGAMGGSRAAGTTTQGRWPANLILDEEAAALLDAEAPVEGGPSRFFYVAKASRSEREAGLEHRAPRNVNDGRETSIDNPYQRGDTQRLNTHPTVKPIALMRWLVRLITPPGGIVLDPFTGSGSTGAAAVLEGAEFLGCEVSEEYAEIARARIAWWAANPPKD